MILLVSDKPKLNIIVSRIYHHPCLDVLSCFHYYAFSSLTLLHPHNSPPAMISILKTWFCNDEGVVNTFFCITGEDEKLRKSWSTKPLEVTKLTYFYVEFLTPYLIYLPFLRLQGLNFKIYRKLLQLPESTGSQQSIPAVSHSQRAGLSTVRCSNQASIMVGTKICWGWDWHLFW